MMLPRNSGLISKSGDQAARNDTLEHAAILSAGGNACQSPVKGPALALVGHPVSVPGATLRLERFEQADGVFR